MDGVKLKILMLAIDFLVRELGKEKNEQRLREAADWVLDYAEDFVLGTKSDIDDRTILPLCKMIRRSFGIPD